MPPTAGGFTLAAYHHCHGRRSLASVELLSSVPLLLTAAVYLHATRRGKFAIWAELLADQHLHGDTAWLWAAVAAR